MIQRKISHGVQSRQGAIYRRRLLTVTTTLRQQGRDIWQFLEQAWIAHHRGGIMPSLLPDPLGKGEEQHLIPARSVVWSGLHLPVGASRRLNRYDESNVWSGW